MAQIQKYLTKFHEEQDLLDLIETTFDTCATNKEEIYWLIAIIRGFLNIPNKRTDYCAENFKINFWQYQMHPIIEKFKKKYHHSNY